MTLAELDRHLADPGLAVRARTPGRCCGGWRREGAGDYGALTRYGSGHERRRQLRPRDRPPPRRSGWRTRVTRHGPVRSLAEAAAARGVEPSAVVKTLVVRLSDDDYRFVLVPGDREIAWPKLRALLGVNRLSMPSAEVALDVTGYVRGTITPLGAATAWPVIADASLSGPVSVGGGAHGVALTVDADELVAALGATVADVTEPRD